MKKKVMKQVIKRQREQIENLTKALAAMSTLNKKSSTTDIPIGTVPYVNGTRIDPRLNKRLTPPGLAESIKEAEKENREFIEVPASVYDDPSLYPDGMRTFSFRTIKADSKHEDARIYMDPKDACKATITDPPYMKPNEGKKNADTEAPSSVVKSLYPSMDEHRDGDYHRNLAKNCLDDDDYVYRVNWRDLFAAINRANLPIDTCYDEFTKISNRLKSGSDLEALIMTRAAIEGSSVIRATIWLIEAMRFLNEQCSDGKYNHGKVTDEPVHGMLLTAFRTASSDLRQIIAEAAFDTYNEAGKESKEEN